MSNFRVRMQERRARQAELPFWQRGLYLPLAVLVVAALIASGVFLAISGGEEDPAASSTEPTPSADGPVATATQEPEDDATTSAPVAAEPSPEAPGDCDTPSSRSGDDALTVAPDVEWSPVGNASTASSSNDGPAINEAPRRCYALTATGALLAVNNFAAEASGGQTEMTEILKLRVLEGTEIYDALSAEVAAGEGSDGSVPVTTVAYRFLDASAESYTVAVVFSVPTSSGATFLEARVEVEWLEGDWMVVGGSPLTQIGEVPAGYVSWGPSAGAVE